MHENHQYEQYFFDGTTLAHLAGTIERFERPVLLCAPMLGLYLHEHGRQVTILDVDDRFADVPGFRHWSIHRPEALDFKPDLIFCDPPFYTVKLDRLYRALTILACGDMTVPLAMCWLERRENALLGTLAQFDLHPTNYMPDYVSVPQEVRIRLYTSHWDW